QPMHEMGTLALERLYARIKDPTAPPTVVSFLPQLVIRKTCGAAGGGDRPVPSLGHIELAQSVRDAG
ncbi:MAG: hypothetical protein AB1428_14765, partial [Bacteroidota bacterium]